MPEPETTTEKPTVHEAWIDVMEDVQAIGKGERSTGGASFSFRGVDTVVNAVGPVLRKHGVSVVPARVVAERNEFTTANKGTRMQEAFLTVTWRVTGPRGDSFEMETVGAASDASDKATSQAHSVAYRIAFLQGLCIPTDDPEPDMHHTDRSNEDEAAREGGWQSAAQRDGVWARKVTHDQAAHPDVVAWAKAEKLNPASFTVAQSEAWTDLMDGLQEGASARYDAAAEAVNGPTDPDVAPDAEPGGDPGTWEGFPSFEAAQAAYADLSAQTMKLVGKPGEEVMAWVIEAGIHPNALTKGQAAEWFAMLSDRLGSEVSKPVEPVRDFKSKAEGTREFDSLLERQSKLPDDVAGVVIDTMKAKGLKKTGFTRQMAEDWLAEIIDAELALQGERSF